LDRQSRKLFTSQSLWLVFKVQAACCLPQLLGHPQQMKNKIRIKSCQVCQNGVGASNAIKCLKCTHRVHKRCSGIQGRIVANPNYVCPRCRGQACPIDGKTVKQVHVDGTLLDVEASFCYLGDMLSAGGSCSLAIITRCCTAWGKFKKFLLILTSKNISLTVRGKLFDAYVRSALLYESETWAPTAPDLQRLHRNDRSLIIDGSVASSPMMKSPLIRCVQGWGYRR